MNRRPPGLLLSKCITGFLQYKTAEGLSPNTLDSNTLDSYGRILDNWSLDNRNRRTRLGSPENHQKVSKNGLM